MLGFESAFHVVVFAPKKRVSGHLGEDWYSACWAGGLSSPACLFSARFSEYSYFRRLITTRAGNSLSFSAELVREISMCVGFQRFLLGVDYLLLIGVVIRAMVTFETDTVEMSCLWEIVSRYLRIFRILLSVGYVLPLGIPPSIWIKASVPEAFVQLIGEKVERFHRILSSRSRSNIHFSAKSTGNVDWRRYCGESTPDYGWIIIMGWCWGLRQIGFKLVSEMPFEWGLSWSTWLSDKEIIALCLIKCQNVNGLEAVVKLSPLTCRLLFFMNIATCLLNGVRFKLELLTYTMAARLSKGEQDSINDIIVSYPQIRAANETRAEKDICSKVSKFY